MVEPEQWLCSCQADGRSARRCVHSAQSPERANLCSQWSASSWGCAGKGWPTGSLYEHDVVMACACMPFARSPAEVVYAVLVVRPCEHV